MVAPRYLNKFSVHLRLLPGIDALHVHRVAIVSCLSYQIVAIPAVPTQKGPGGMDMYTFIFMPFVARSSFRGDDSLLRAIKWLGGELWRVYRKHHPVQPYPACPACGTELRAGKLQRHQPCAHLMASQAAYLMYLKADLLCDEELPALAELYQELCRRPAPVHLQEWPQRHLGPVVPPTHRSHHEP